MRDELKKENERMNNKGNKETTSDLSKGGNLRGVEKKNPLEGLDHQPLGKGCNRTGKNGWKNRNFMGYQNPIATRVLDSGDVPFGDTEKTRGMACGVTINSKQHG